MHFLDKSFSLYMQQDTHIYRICASIYIATVPLLQLLWLYYFLLVFMFNCTTESCEAGIDISQNTPTHTSSI